MKNVSRKLIITVILLTIFGLVMIYSSSSIWANYKYNDSFHYLKSQILFSTVSFFAMFIISKINYKQYYKHSTSVVFVCLILLVLVLIPGIGKVRNGSRSWFAIGPLGFQPSELAKIGLIIFTSKYLSINRNKLNNFKSGLMPLLIVISIFFGLIMLEPDFGSAMVIILTLVVILFTSGINISYFAWLGIFGLLGVIALIIVAPYRLKRVISFLNPWSDPLGTGFQIIQSLYAIGPGGLFGLGFGNSIQKQFYLPEPQTDFIFSIICEEFGILGALFICILFFNLFRYILKISLNQDDLFAKYLSFGLGFQIIFQALLNLCVVVGLIPVTGVTLPFISYGGSSLLITLCSIGIIVNISK